MTIRPIAASDQAEWLRLLGGLFPASSASWQIAKTSSAH
jgi:hypothetical protein